MALVRAIRSHNASEFMLVVLAVCAPGQRFDNSARKTRVCTHKLVERCPFSGVRRTLGCLLTLTNFGLAALFVGNATQKRLRASAVLQE